MAAGGHYPGYSAPVAAVAPQLRAVPPRDERVDLNPGGRLKNQAAAGGSSLGSMESLNSNQDSVFSFGSTISSNGELQLCRLVLPKVASECYPKVRNHGEGTY